MTRKTSSARKRLPRPDHFRLGRATLGPKVVTGGSGRGGAAGRRRRPAESMAWIWMLPAAGAVLLWAISLGRILSSPAPSRLPPNPHFLPPLRDDRRSRNVLLVVAHPDDESMFFAPTILFLKSKGHNIQILCISQGNADGLGNIQKQELYYACDTLKIPRNQVKVLDHPKLQDGFHEQWDHGLLAELTLELVQLWDIDTSEASLSGALYYLHHFQVSSWITQVFAWEWTRKY